MDENRADQSRRQQHVAQRIGTDAHPALIDRHQLADEQTTVGQEQLGVAAGFDEIPPANQLRDRHVFQRRAIGPRDAKYQAAVIGGDQLPTKRFAAGQNSDLVANWPVALRSVVLRLAIDGRSRPGRARAPSEAA